MAEAPVQQEKKNSSDNCLLSPSTAADKKHLRKKITAYRDSISDETRTVKDQSIAARLYEVKAFSENRATLFYAAFRSEVRTEHLIRQSLSDNRITSLPRVDKTNELLRLYQIGNWSELAPGSWGILEPDEDKTKEIGIDDIDIVLAPGVAFDENCNRLGYGKGYYDKLLCSKKGLKPLVIGLAYEEQIVDALPCYPHDIKMDMIITDKRIITCHEP